MRKVLTGLALLAPAIATAQTLPQRQQSGYDTGYIVNCLGLDGVSAARCLVPSHILVDQTGTPLGTSANPVYVSGATGGGGSGGSVPTGSAGNPNANVVTVQGIAGGITLPATISNNGFASFGSAGTAYQQGTGAAGANAQNVYIGGQFQPLNGQTTDSFVAPAAMASSAGTAYTVTLGKGQGTVAFAITGLTASGATLQSQYSDDNGANFYPLRNIGTATVPGTTTFTTDGPISFTAAGHTQLRLIVTTAGSGNITIGSNASVPARGVNLEGAGTAATNPLFATITSTTETTIANNQTNGTQVVRGPSSTPVNYGGVISASGGTLAIPFVNTSDQDVFNSSNAMIWCSWATPTVSGSASYPIASYGYFRPPNRPAGTLTCLSTAANQAVGSWRY